MPFATTWMDVEIITLSEVSQTEKDKCHMISFHVESKKNNTDELIYRNRLIDIENKLMVNEGGK